MPPPLPLTMHSLPRCAVDTSVTTTTTTQRVLEQFSSVQSSPVYDYPSPMCQAGEKSEERREMVTGTSNGALAHCHCGDRLHSAQARLIIPALLPLPLPRPYNLPAIGKFFRRCRRCSLSDDTLFGVSFSCALQKRQKRRHSSYLMIRLGFLIS